LGSWRRRHEPDRQDGRERFDPGARRRFLQPEHDRHRDRPDDAALRQRQSGRRHDDHQLDPDHQGQRQAVRLRQYAVLIGGKPSLNEAAGLLLRPRLFWDEFGPAGALRTRRYSVRLAAIHGVVPAKAGMTRWQGLGACQPKGPPAPAAATVPGWANGALCKKLCGPVDSVAAHSSRWQNASGGAAEMESRYGWVLVVAGAVMTCVAMGAIFALPVYLQPMDDTGWSRAGISAAMTLGFVVMGIGGFGWGALSDRIGARPVVLMAGLLLGAGLILASRASNLVTFQFAYGVLA